MCCLRTVDHEVNTYVSISFIVGATSSSTDFCSLGILQHNHGPLTRYVKLQVAHAPGMPGKFFPAAVFKGNR